MLPENLGHLFATALKLSPSQPAVFQGDTVLTYRELDERCNRVANALCGLGVETGGRVALMFGNDFRFLECFFGPMRMGAVSVPLNTRLGDDALTFILDDAEATVVIADASMAARAARVAGGRPAVQVVVGGPNLQNTLSYGEILEAASPLPTPRKTDAREICMQPYTSGSTGKPKGALLDHGGQIWNADTMRKAMMLDETDRALVAVPLFHKNAMAGAVKPFLIAGASIVILPAFDAVEVIRAISRYKITYLTGVPAMYKMILAESDALQKHSVESVRYAMIGSAEVPDELVSEFTRVFGAAMAEGYGLTEGGPVPLFNTRWGLQRRGSCGRVVPGSDVRIVADDGITDVDPGEIGELVVRNPGMAQGYWKRPAETGRKFRDGWLFTGDLFRRDSDGYFYFVGRKDDVINVSGEKVYPKEVEDILMRHANVRDACVVAAPHPVKGEVPVAFVLEKKRGRTTETELQDHFLLHGAPYAYPRKFYLRESLPLLGTGKHDRSAMKQLARDDAASLVREREPRGTGRRA